MHACRSSSFHPLFCGAPPWHGWKCANAPAAAAAAEQKQCRARIRDDNAGVFIEAGVGAPTGVFVCLLVTTTGVASALQMQAHFQQEQDTRYTLVGSIGDAIKQELDILQVFIVSIAEYCSHCAAFKDWGHCG